MLLLSHCPNLASCLFLSPQLSGDRRAFIQIVASSIALAGN